MKWLALALLAIVSTASAQWLCPVTPEQPKDGPVTLYGEVNDKSAADLIDAIHARNHLASKLPILLFLNSPGGSVVAGDMIVDAIDASRRPIVTIDVGYCASMCAIIFEHGAKRLMLPSAFVMFHEASAGTEGDLSHMVSQVVLWSRIVARNEAYISKRSGVPLDELRAHESAQWWLLAEDALAAHLADAVVRIGDYPAPRE